MPIQGYLLETPTELEVVSAYGVLKSAVPSRNASPGWFVIGGFFLSKGVIGVQHEVIGMVNHADLEMHVRLFNVNDLEVVSGSEVTIVSTTALVRALSGSFNLTGIRTYQVQAEAIGAQDYAKFGHVHTGGITDGI